MDDSAKLTEEELRETAAEAGISPEELRRALVQRSSTLPDKTSSRAIATQATALEGHVQQPPDQATETVRRIVERASGHRGHRQGGGRVDIVDEENGVVYQIASAADGAGGALVKVEINSASTVGNFALASFIVGTFTLGVVAFGYMVWAAMMWVGVALGGIGIFALISASRRLEQGRQRARTIAAEALLEAEEAPSTAGPIAIPPRGREGI
ncbi:MAG: hypothetical protein R3B09_03660 [Nannocystaceae bacterium]